MGIIFIGNIVDKEICNTLSSCSPAGNKWQENFIKNLEKISNEKITNLSIIPLRVFPLSKDISIKKFKNKNKEASNLISYLNILFFKKISIFISVMYYLIKNAKENDKIIIYNLYSPVFLAVNIFKRFCKIKFVGIIADIVLENDLKYKGLKKFLYEFGGKSQKKFLQNLDEVIAVNRLILKDFNIKNGTILEGGVDTLKIEKKDKLNHKTRKVIFAGTLDNLNGIEFLLKSFSKLKNDDVELHIYGRGPLTDMVEKETKNNPKIIYKGFVSSEKIKNILLNGDLLIIPRLKSIKTLRYTFPSKLFEYMLSGTPVLMTKIPGLGKEYEEYIYMKDTEDPQEFSEFMKVILNFSEEILIEKGKKAQKFITDQKNWEKQVKRVYNEVIL